MAYNIKYQLFIKNLELGESNIFHDSNPRPEISQPKSPNLTFENIVEDNLLLHQLQLNI